MFDLLAVPIVDFLVCLLQQGHLGVEGDNDVLLLLQLGAKLLLQVRLGLLLQASLHARVLLRSLKSSHLLPKLPDPPKRAVLGLLHHLLHLAVLRLELPVGLGEVGIPALVLVVPGPHLAEHGEEVLLADGTQLGRTRVVPSCL